MAALDHGQFLERFLKEESRLRAFLLAATGSAEAMDDLLQSTAKVLLLKWGEFYAERPFGPWAMGVARLEALKWRQRIARSREVLSEEGVERLSEAAEELAPEEDRRHRYLVDCVESLRAEHRDILNMRYGQGLKALLIAERLGKSVPAMKMILVRIRKVLRDCIERKAMGAAGET